MTCWLWWIVTVETITESDGNFYISCSMIHMLNCAHGGLVHAKRWIVLSLLLARFLDLTTHDFHFPLASSIPILNNTASSLIRCFKLLIHTSFISYLYLLPLTSHTFILSLYSHIHTSYSSLNFFSKQLFTSNELFNQLPTRLLIHFSFTSFTNYAIICINSF